MSVPIESHDSPRWGAGATIGFSLACGLVITMAQLVAIGIVAATRIEPGSEPDIEKLLDGLTGDGGMLAVMTIVGAVVGIALVLGIIKLKRGASVVEYLALKPIPAKTLGIVLAIAAAFIVASDSLSLLLGRSIVPEFGQETYATRTWPVLFWVALVVAAPALEEVYFRGFILAGLRRSRLGDIGAIVVIAAVWALLHTQYGLYEIVTILVQGVVLGIVRIRTGSLWSVLVMHAFSNLVATVEAALHASGAFG